MCGIAGFQIFKNNLDIDCTKKIKEITEVINLDLLILFI